MDFRNRVLSPTLGRWLSNDPLGFGAGDVNKYRYETDAPTNALDPMGLEETGEDETTSSYNVIIGGRKYRLVLIGTNTRVIITGPGVINVLEQPKVIDDFQFALEPYPIGETIEAPDGGPFLIGTPVNPRGEDPPLHIAPYQEVE